MLEKNEHGWWLGVRTKPDGTLRKGFFPKNYVKKKPVVEAPKPPPRPTSMLQRALPSPPPAEPTADTWDAVAPQKQWSPHSSPASPHNRKVAPSSPGSPHSPGTHRGSGTDRVPNRNVSGSGAGGGGGGGSSSKHPPASAVTSGEHKVVGQSSSISSGSDKYRSMEGAHSASRDGRGISRVSSGASLERGGRYCLSSLAAFNELRESGYTVELRDGPAGSTTGSSSGSGRSGDGDDGVGSSRGIGSSSSSSSKSAGREVRRGMKVRLKCSARVWDGASALTREFANGLVNFVVGSGQVTLGMETAVQRLRVGQRAMITCAPSMAYGPAGNPPVVPPNAHVIFAVEIVSASEQSQAQPQRASSSGAGRIDGAAPVSSLRYEVGGEFSSGRPRDGEDKAAHGDSNCSSSRKPSSGRRDPNSKISSRGGVMGVGGPSVEQEEEEQARTRALLGSSVSATRRTGNGPNGPSDPSGRSGARRGSSGGTTGSRAGQQASVGLTAGRQAVGAAPAPGSQRQQGPSARTASPSTAASHSSHGYHNHSQGLRDPVYVQTRAEESGVGRGDGSVGSLGVEGCSLVSGGEEYYKGGDTGSLSLNNDILDP